MVAAAPLQPTSRSAAERRAPAAGRCLVASGCAPLRRRIRAVAEACGWECVTPCDAAGVAAAGGGYGVVFIDLVRPPAAMDAAELLAAGFAADRDSRVVVCGAPDRPDEEMLVRQVGPCIYVPGVAVGPGLAALVRAVCRADGA